MHISKGRYFIIVVSLVLPVSLSGQQGKSFKYHLDGALKSACIVNPDHSIIIDYNIPEVNFTGIKNTHGDFFRISIPGHNTSSDPGKPELPVFTRLITIPENSTPVITISSIRSEKMGAYHLDMKGLLYPRQESGSKNDKQKTDFKFDKEVYSKKGLISSDTVRIDYVGKVRNTRLATVSISPVRYNPYLNELEVITSMKISISFDHSGSKSTVSSSSGSALFDQSLGKGTLNYIPDGFITGYSDKPVGMVILTDTTFRKNLRPYINWKTEEGYKVTTLYKGTWPGGDSYTGIKDTLTKIYNAGTEAYPAPEYLLIVGDVNKIPLSEGTSQVSDLYYGEFDGNGDYIPEMFIGRLPVADTTELNNVLTKLLQYEKFQFADSNKFYTKALVTAGNDGGYYDYMNGQVNYASENYLNSSNGIEGHAFLYPKSASSIDSIKGLINSGISFVNYTGHGVVDGWEGPALKTADISNLKNNNMYPLVITNACQTAHFSVSTSFGNKMITTAGKGAIGYIGCSNDSYWDEDYFWSVGAGSISSDPKYDETGLGAYDRLFHLNGENPSDWYITLGQINYAGNMSVSASTSPRKKYYWETYTLLGDPSMIPVIGKPDSLNLPIPNILPKGITSFSLTTTPFAYIGVTVHDSLWDASYAGSDGSVVLKLPGLTHDSCLIVATGQNKVPFIKKVRFGSVSGEFINLTSSLINDSLENNNGRADYNESVWLSLKIDNLGLQSSDSLSAKLSTTSTLVTLNSDSVYIGTLGSQSQILIPRAMAIKIADSVPDMALVPFDLLIRDRKGIKKYRIDIFVHAPDLSIVSCYLDDSVTGNGNYIPEPGETVNLVFTVTNSGSGPAPGTFQINSLRNGVMVEPPGAKSGVIDKGTTATYSMPVVFSPTMSSGEYFSIISQMSCAPYNTSRNFNFRIGKSRENFEAKSFYNLPWVNISGKPWTISGQDVFDGRYSARSGQITNNESTSLLIMTNLTVADSLRFYCKVSSELNYDFLTFRINGSTVFRISGESGWQRKSVLLPAGLDRIEWIYSKDEAVSAGLDCAFLDLIDFPDPNNILFIQRDLSVDRIMSPLQNSDFLFDSVSVKVSNQGRDPINGFNLAYSVNGVSAGYQHFNDVLNSFQDSATVWFIQKPDLSKYDIYSIKVYSANNNEDYHLNDTASISIRNVEITDPFKAFPNPFIDKLSITINTASDQNATITLTNSSGVVLRIYKRALSVGKNDIEIDSPDLASGFYYLTVTARTFRYSIPLIKVK